MDGMLSREEAAKFFKVSVPTFNKYARLHPDILQGKSIILHKLQECIEKESAHGGAEKEK